MPKLLKPVYILDSAISFLSCSFKQTYLFPATSYPGFYVHSYFFPSLFQRLCQSNAEGGHTNICFFVILNLC